MIILTIEERRRVNLRSLIVFASRPHYDVSGRSPRLDGLLVPRVSSESGLGEAEYLLSDASHVTRGVGGHGTQETLTGLSRQVGLLENTLGRVEIRQVETGTRVARVEYSRQPDTGLERLHNHVMKVVVDDVARVLVIYRVDNFIVTVLLVTVFVLRLSTMTCIFVCVSDCDVISVLKHVRTYPSNGRTRHRSAGRP